MGEPSSQQLLQQAMALHRQGKLLDAEQYYRRVLTDEPAHVGALNLYGLLAHQIGRVDIAAPLFRRAILADPAGPSGAEAHNHLANILREQNQLEQAIEHYHAALTITPNFFQALSNLGTVYKQLRRIPDAIACYRGAVQLQPQIAHLHVNLGVALRESGEYDEAARCYAEALRLDPGHALARNNLGNLLRDQGRLEDAIAEYRAVLSAHPNHELARSNLATVLRDLGRLEESESEYRAVLAGAPNSFEAWFGLGNTLLARGPVSEARAALQRALSLRADSVDAQINLAKTFEFQGRLEEAVAAYRGSIERHPNDPRPHSALLFAINHHPKFDGEAILNEHRAWATKHADPLRPMISVLSADRAPDRRLKLGYVSPDFRAHAVASFVEPILAHHHREQFEIFCYATSSRADEVTARLQSHGHHWRHAALLNDGALARQISSDGIDILIDLAGHTAGNRLLMFAGQAAPIQITYLGYPATTGLSTMQYRLTDAVADPPGETERFHTEELLRVAGCFLCYRPPHGAPDRSVRREGPITFCCFNRLSKVGSAALDLFAEVLRAAPESRLLLKDRALADQATRALVIDELGKRGVSANRIELRPATTEYADHLAAYLDADVALDTFPYNGTSTTLEALWMGVPVVTLAGQLHAGRVGACILTNAGLGEYVAETPADFAKTAAALASNAKGTRETGLTLRDRLAASPVMNEPAFVREFEQALRDVWRRYVTG